MDFFGSILLATSLGGVSGLRITTTPLVLALGSYTPFFTLPENMIWLASPEMLGLWFLINFVEFGAFSVPVLGSGFDVAALGIAPLSSAFFVTGVTEMDFMTAMLFAGAPSAGVQLATSGVRAISGPFAPVVSLFESVTAFIAGILAIILPILSIALMVWLVVWGVKQAKQFVQKRRTMQEPIPPTT